MFNSDFPLPSRSLGIIIIDKYQMRKSSSSCQVYAVASEDMDSLTFGAPKFLRHLMDPSSKKIPVMEFDISKVTWV